MELSLKRAFFFVLALFAWHCAAASPQVARCSTQTLVAKLRTPQFAKSVVLDSATIVKATQSVHSYCDVRGHVHTENDHREGENPNLQQKEIQFRLYLPVDWNQKFLMFGCGGFCGKVDERTTALDRGYATASTDAGHSSNDGTDASWARNVDGTQNFDRIMNFAHRSPHIVTLAAKNIIQTYYRRSPQLSYFLGGSNGGRQALIEAQRYPEDFDGIVALFPAINLSATIASFVKNSTVQKGILDNNAVNVLSKAVMTKCDPADGLADGIISDPGRCTFNAMSDIPSCEQKSNVPNCLTRDQSKAIATFMEPTRLSGIGEVHPGSLQGYEDVAGNWDRWLVNEDETAQKKFAENFLRYFVYNDPSFDLAKFNLQTSGYDLFRSPSGLELDNALSSKSYDLELFKARGSKLIIIHGLADPAISVLSTEAYYNLMTRVMGGPEKTKSFARLFFVPGYGHGTIALNHPARVDALVALEKWRESKIPPDFLIGYDGDKFETSNFTRPICAYPLKATYSGSGSVRSASSFRCE